MLETFAIVFFIAWLLGMSSSCTLGGLIQILLLFAVTLMPLRVFKSRHRS